MSVSTRTRFEIFKRDGFRCVYCGATPMNAVLTVDHVEPQAKGGGDDPSNLVTACQACNGGKSDVRLEDRRYAASLDTDSVKEHAQQLMGYLEAQRAVVAAKDAVVEQLRERWEELINGGTTAQERGLLRAYSETYPLAELVGAMEIAAAKFGPFGNYEGKFSQDAEDRRRVRAFKYLCGIVRRWRETGVVSVQIPDDPERN